MALLVLALIKYLFEIKGNFSIAEPIEKRVIIQTQVIGHFKKMRKNILLYDISKTKIGRKKHKIPRKNWLNCADLTSLPSAPLFHFHHQRSPWQTLRAGSRNV